MNTLIPVFHRTILPAVAVLTLLIAVANARPAKTVSAKGVASQTATVAQIADTSSCNIPPMPTFSSLTSDTCLPDPFTFMDSTRMTSTGQWQCRRAEIAALAQKFIYGYKHSTPYSATTGSMSGNTLTVTVVDSGDTISFACPITYPTTGKAPYPAMITVGVSSLPSSAILNMGVAIITFPSDQIAVENDATSRGQGLYYNLYGSNDSAGALIAWAWGVDRLIDAIEKTPADSIDPTRLGATGCSRWGKGALCVGAFDERIKLTIPEESGSGGAASWRVSDWELAQNVQNQALTEIVGENCWFRQSFSQFSGASDKLPVDQNSVIDLVAPRAILMIENDFLWLGPQSTWICANAANMLFDALGIVDYMGFWESTAHNHCAFPSAQQSAVTSYVERFLLGDSTQYTYLMEVDNTSYTFDRTKWVNWKEPTLTVTGVHESRQQSIPNGFYLEPTYPNPFNPSTTISFGVPKNIFVSLKVYNILGQQVAELAGQEYPAGRHSVTFNASKLASGVYFCAMKAGDFSMIQKMILEK